MDYRALIENLKEWHENLIGEMCADDKLTCDDLCGCTGPCIVMQAANAIADLLDRVEESERKLAQYEGQKRV